MSGRLAADLGGYRQFRDPGQHPVRRRIARGATQHLGERHGADDDSCVTVASRYENRVDLAIRRGGLADAVRVQDDRATSCGPSAASGHSALTSSSTAADTGPLMASISANNASS